MLPTRQGSIHLFRVAGLNVWLHWSWFVIAMFEISYRRGSFVSPAWIVLEYVTLFVIVLLHEMGHAFACRSVGGQADEIVLWPFGGVAYVAPPMRPGATLWSIAAGPLVNVALFFPLTLLLVLTGTSPFAVQPSDPNHYLQAVWWTNAVLLGFNLLPIYPLDGGQILRSLLWFAVGRARSLMAASVIGIIGVPVLFLLAWWESSIWLGILALLIVSLCWRGLQHARQLARVAALPRRDGFKCPSCETAPPIGAWWVCGRCGKPFDTFESGAVCPHCGAQFSGTRCLDCGTMHAMDEWRLPPPVL